MHLKGKVNKGACADASYPVAYVTVVLLSLSFVSFVNMDVLGAPVYAVQFLIGIVAFLLYFFTGAENKLYITSFDRLIVLFIAYNFLSYVINVFINIESGDLYLILHQSVSLATLFSFVFFYFLGKLYVRNDAHVKIFSDFLIFFFVITLIVLLVFYYYYRTDLYAARAIVGQRLPLMMCFFGWLAGFMYFSARKRNNIYLMAWVLSSICVVLSLTRASYLQWFVSFFFMLVILKKINLKTLIYVFLLMIVLYAILETYGDSNAIVARLYDLVHFQKTAEVDHSASLRIQIWLGLLEVITNDPLGLLIGYGQLGPSYFQNYYVATNGTVITATSAHSQYLDTVFRSGLFGLMLELYVIYLAVKSNSNSLFFSRFTRANLVALSGVMIYGVFHETFRWQMFGLYFWFYLGVHSNYLVEQQAHFIRKLQ